MGASLVDSESEYGTISNATSERQSLVSLHQEGDSNDEDNNSDNNETSESDRNLLKKPESDEDSKSVANQCESLEEDNYDINSIENDSLTFKDVIEINQRAMNNLLKPAGPTQVKEKQKEVVFQTTTSVIDEETIPQAEPRPSKVELGPKYKKSVSVSTSIALQTEPEPSNIPLSLPHDPLDDLADIYANKRELTSSDTDTSSEGDSEHDGVDKPFYEKLDTEAPSAEVEENMEEQELFEKPSTMITTPFENFNAINDLKELLQWKMKTETSNTILPFFKQQEEMEDYDICDTYKVIDAKIEQSDKYKKYNRYIKDCDIEIASEAYKVPMVTKVLRMSESISVFEKNKDAAKNTITQPTEEDSFENAIIATNSISDLRIQMQQFTKDLTMYTDQYQGLMGRFINNYNACYSREELNVENVTEENLETNELEKTAIKKNVNCSLEMQLAHTNLD